MIIIVAVVVIVIIIGYFISKSSGSTPTVQSKTSPQEINVSLKVTEEESHENTPELNQELTPKGTSEGTTTVTPDGTPEITTEITVDATPDATKERIQEETPKKNENTKNSATSVPNTLHTTIPSFPTPHSNPIIDEVVNTIFEKPHEYGYYDKQDIKSVVEDELTKVSINKWNWNWKKNLIKNLILNSVKNLKVKQVKETPDETGNITYVPPTVPSFPTPHSNPIIDEVVNTILEKPIEYGNKQDITRVVEDELKKLSFFEKRWNLKKNLISNSLKKLKKLKVEQVKQKFQENNYTLNKDLDLDKLINTVIDKNNTNNTDEIYKHVIEEIEKTQTNITSPTNRTPPTNGTPSPTTSSPTTPLSLSNSLSKQLSKQLSKSQSTTTQSPTTTTPPTTTTTTTPSPTPTPTPTPTPSPSPPPSPPSPTTPTTPSPSPPPSPPSPTTPTTPSPSPSQSPPSPTDEPKNNNFMNLLHLLSSRM